MGGIETAGSKRRAAAGFPGANAVGGLLLCGGRSARMGSDKALLPLGDRRLIELPLAVLAEVAGATRLAVGREPRYSELGLEQVLDDAAWSGAGPVAGLLAGLEAATTEWVCVLACDMPRASAALLRELLARATAEDLDACLLRTEQGVEPLFAVYRRSCAPAIRRALERGRYKMTGFHEGTIDGRPLRIGELAVGAEGAAAAANLNTLDELAGERRRRGVAERAS